MQTFGVYTARRYQPPCSFLITSITSYILLTYNCIYISSPFFLIFRFCPGIWFIFSKHSLFVGINCFLFTLFFYSFPLEEGKELGRQNGRRGRELIDLYLFFQIFCLYISFLIYIYKFLSISLYRIDAMAEYTRTP